MEIDYSRRDIWYCGDDRYRISVGGTYGFVLDKCFKTHKEAMDFLEKHKNEKYLDRYS